MDLFQVDFGEQADYKLSLIARFMGPIWGRQDPGGPMLAAWTLLSGNMYKTIWIS